VSEFARTKQIAANAVYTLYQSGRYEDLPDEELDALVAELQTEQHERDERREYRVIPDCPF